MRKSGKPAPFIGFVDPDQDDQWPDTVSSGVRRYLTGLVRQTPKQLIRNAHGVETRILRVDHSILPVQISDGASGKASILSPYAHHVSYPIEEISKQTRGPPAWALRTMLLPLTLLLRSGRIDRCVFVNHWLLSGAPEADVANGRWGEIVRFLTDRFPGHAVVLQDVKPDLDAARAKALRTVGGLFVPTRQVHIVDPKRSLAGQENKKVRYARNLSRRLYQSHLHRMLPDKPSSDQAPRLSQMYRFSNITRHSALNPDYTPAFFELALACDEFRWHVWQDHDHKDISAFNLQRSDERFICWSTFGVEPADTLQDEDLPNPYQLIVAADLHESDATGLLLDWGAGAGEFKRFRGAQTFTQYEVVFVGHLSVWRRGVWHCLAWLRNIRRRQQERGARKARDRTASQASDRAG